MGLFSFFKNKNDGSISKLSTAILQSSNKLVKITTKESSALWEEQGLSSEEKETIGLCMLFEFVYCHIAVTDRIAFSTLSISKRNELIDQLGSILRYSIVETVFSGWDEGIKKKFNQYFIEGYNEAMERYAQATSLLDKEMFSGNGTLQILGREISMISNSPMNPEIIMRTIEITGVSVRDLQIDKYVKQYDSGN